MTLTITAIANSLADGLDDNGLEFMIAFLSQLTSTLATIAVMRPDVNLDDSPIPL